jgi:toxin ParE1/3/4
MASKVRRSPQARRDLIQVWRYIAADNERAADRLLDRVDEILSMPGDNPKAERARLELGADMRSVPVAS